MRRDELFWAMAGDDEGCYMMLDGRGIVRGYALQLEPELWRWRTEDGEGTEARRDDAMDAAEESLEVEP